MTNGDGEGRVRVRAPQRLVAGVVFVAMCVFVLWAVRDLSMGSVKFMGPAMLPRVLAVMLGAAGMALIVLSLIRDGDALEPWPLRGPAMVTLAIVLFALTIREFGLVVAGFLSLFVSGYATAEARPREVLIFAVAMTAATVLLFRYALGMAVPVLIIPGLGVDL